MAKKLLEVWKEGNILLVKSKLAWLVEVTSEEDLTEADAMEVAAHITMYSETMDVPDNAVGWSLKYNYDKEKNGEIVDIVSLSAETLASIDPS